MRTTELNGEKIEDFLVARERSENLPSKRSHSHKVIRLSPIDMTRLGGDYFCGKLILVVDPNMKLDAFNFIHQSSCIQDFLEARGDQF